MTATESELRLGINDDPAPVPAIKKATTAEAVRIAGHPSAFTVRFGSIHVADNIRADDITGVDSLADDIRRHGLLQPIAVRPYGVDTDGRPVFVVEAGHRRYNALRALQLDDDDLVPVHPVTDATGTERTVRQYIENVQRRPLSPVDEATAIRTLMQRYEHKLGDAAAALGIDRNTASRRLLLLRLPDHAQRLVADGEWEIEAAQSVGRLIRDKAPAKLIEQLIADRATRTRSAAAVDEWTQKRQYDRLVAQLESRGFTVVSGPKNGPAPDGYRTEMHRRLCTGTLTEIKQLDTKSVDTVRDTDGRPVVWLSRSAIEAELHVYSLRLREMIAPAADPVDDADRPLTHRVREAGRTEMSERRLARLAEWFAGDHGHSETDRWVDLQVDPMLIQRAALRIMLARSHSIDLDRIAATIDAEPVMTGDWINVEATADAWYETLDGEQTGSAMLLLVLATGVQHLGWADGKTEPVSPIGRLAVDVAGVPDVLDVEQFRSVALYAVEQAETATA